MVTLGKAGPMYCAVERAHQAEQQPADQRAGRAADAAQHDDDEGVQRPGRLRRWARRAG